MDKQSNKMTILPIGTYIFEPDGIHQVTLQFPDADSAIVFFEWCKQCTIVGEQKGSSG